MSSKIKKILGLATVGMITVSATAYAGSGFSSYASINYDQTISTNGKLVPMYYTVDVTGYVNPASTNDCWYELVNDSNNVYNDALAYPNFSGNLVTWYSVPTDDYKLRLNPDGPNYTQVIANGTAQN